MDGNRSKKQFNNDNYRNNNDLNLHFEIIIRSKLLFNLSFINNILRVKIIV